MKLKEIKAFICKSLLAGIFIGLASLTSICIENKYVGALIFSMGLLTIVKMQLNLYTGKVGYANTIKDALRVFLIYILNLIGVYVISLYAKSLYDNSLWDAKIEGYISTDIISLWIQAIFTGMLMFVAVDSKSEITLVLCVMAFILLEGKHSIAISFWLAPFAYIKETIIFLIGNAIGGQLIRRIKLM